MFRLPTRPAELVILASLVVSWLLPLPVRAQPAAPSAADRAAAESLFNAALELLEGGKPEQACPKLEESQRLDPGVGTLLYLADCYQQMGLTASAWATFREAAYLARSQGQTEREQIGIEHAAALEDKLSYLTVEVTPAPGTSLEVRHNGEVMGEARWGARFPVDPGSHMVEASAPGRKRWSKTIKIAHLSGRHRVVIPVLEEIELAPDPASVSPGSAAGPEVDTGGRGTLGWIVVGAGSAAIVTGGIFALLARGDDAEADASCRPDQPSRCNSAGVELGNSAQTKATLAGISIGVGLAALGTGVALLVMAPDGRDDDHAALEVRLHATATGGFGSLGGRF